MAKLADARDWKSRSLPREYRFESGRRYQPNVLADAERCRSRRQSRRALIDHSGCADKGWAVQGVVSPDRKQVALSGRPLCYLCRRKAMRSALGDYDRAVSLKRRDGLNSAPCGGSAGHRECEGGFLSHRPRAGASLTPYTAGCFRAHARSGGRCAARWPPYGVIFWMEKCVCSGAYARAWVSSSASIQGHSRI